MYEDVRKTLDLFEPISLAEMEHVELMERVDLKFCFHVSRLPELLNSVKDQYFVLDHCNTRMTHYQTLYYDTPDYEFFQKHHNEKAHRYKIRLRRYVESNISFFEIKLKNNKGRTIKTRVLNESFDPKITPISEDFFTRTTGMTAADVEPKLMVNYNRTTLVNKHEDERLTIDVNLSMTMNDEKAEFKNLVIVEVKQLKLKETAFTRQLRKAHIREGGTSKYCVAVSKLARNLKINNFKIAVSELNKINYGTRTP